MSLWIDSKYINMLGPQLRNFKRKSEHLWCFSCNYCGDSKTNKTKARAFIYTVKNEMFFKCHKCGHSTNLNSFIKYTNENLHREYSIEVYREKTVPRAVHAPVSDSFFQTPVIKVELSDATLDSLKRIDQMDPNHPAVKYVADREIPQDKWKLLYYCSKFKRYVNSILPGKFRNVDDDDHPRLIIPYFNDHGKCFAFQGRAFGNELPKYTTIKIDDESERVYGLERLDYSKRVYVVEGPIDSLFIPNAIAVSGSSFITPTIKALQSNATIVFDNEPRHTDIARLIKTTIDKGYSVCMWPDTITEKDINLMILAGKTSAELVDIINQNTYSGISASLRLTTWRKHR